jgi:hypothetical protein
MSDSFGMIVGIAVGALFLGVMSMDGQGKGKKTVAYKPQERINPLTENNFSFKPGKDDPKRKK